MGTDLKQKSILIVEDDIYMLKVLVNTFTKRGFTVIKAKDGQEGLDQALKKQPNLILLDLLMPKMDGMTMLQKLRDDAWGKNVPVIILTNLSDTDKALEAKKYGVLDYLVKAEWELEKLVEKIKGKLE